MAASVLVMGAAPASALAGSASGSHARSLSHESKKQLVDVDRAGVVLALGSGYSSRRDAARVRVLQRRLAGLGYGPGPLDGRYGPRTEQAVVRFQAAHGLGVDGIAGRRTFAALRKRSTVLDPGTGVAGRGSRRVRGLQRRLARAGYAPGPIDGRYGPRTEQAVSRFQAAHGLGVDGIAGPRTLVDLGEQSHQAGRHRGRVGSRQRATRAPHGGSSGRHPARRQPGGRSGRHPAQRQPGGIPAPRKLAPVKHSTGAVSIGLLVLLIAFVLGLGLSAVWFARRHRDKGDVDGGERVGGASGRDRSDAVLALLAAPVVNNHGSTVTPGDGDPADGNRAFRRAMLLQDRGDHAGAMVAYQQADQFGHAGAACRLGVLLERQGDRAAAEVAFRRAAKRGNADGAFNLAALLEGQGYLDGALVAYRRADELGHGGASCDLGVLLGQRGDLAGAESCFRRADQRGIPAGAFNLGVLLREQGDHIAALRAFERAERFGDSATADRAREAARKIRSRAPSPTTAGEGGGHGGR